MTQGSRLTSSSSAENQLYSTPRSLTRGIAPSGASCLYKPAPGQIPAAGKRCGVCPGSAQGPALGQWYPRPCSGSCLVLGGFLAQGWALLSTSPAADPAQPRWSLAQPASGQRNCTYEVWRHPAQVMLSAGKQGEGGEGKLLMNRMTGYKVQILRIIRDKGPIALLGRTGTGSMLYCKEDAKQAGAP